MKIFSLDRHRVLWSTTALFVAFLVLAFLRMSCPADLDLYHQYAHIAQDESLPKLYQTCKIEYPPLAIGLILMTERISAEVPESILPYTGKTNQNPSVDLARFKVTYRMEMVACALVTWGMVIVLMRRFFAHETPREWAERLLALTFCIVPMGYVLLDRLDIALTALIMISFVLLLSRWHYAVSFAVLAAAIAFKFVPVALVPIWIVASQPASVLAGLNSIRGWRPFLVGSLSRGAILCTFLVAMAIPLWLIVGSPSLDFFSFHAERGIEFESNYAAVLKVFRSFDYPVVTTRGGGSAVLESPISPLLTQLSAVLVALSLAVSAIVLLLTLHRRVSTRSENGPNSHVPHILGHLLWSLLAFVLFNKTFSPQYVIWLAPLVAVVPMTGMKRRLFQFGFLGVAYLTMLVYPRYIADVLGSPLPSDPNHSTGANAFGAGLLLARLLLLLVLTTSLGRMLLQQARQRQIKSPVQTLAHCASRLECSQRRMAVKLSYSRKPQRRRRSRSTFANPDSATAGIDRDVSADSTPHSPRATPSHRVFSSSEFIGL